MFYKELIRRLIEYLFKLIVGGQWQKAEFDTGNGVRIDSVAAMGTLGRAFILLEQLCDFLDSFILLKILCLPKDCW